MAAPRSDRSAGQYRLRDGASVAGDVLVSRRPLVATRLNSAALDLVAALDDDGFRTPQAVAAETGREAAAAADLFQRLHHRGFLAWRPDCDPGFRPPVSVVVTVRNDREALVGCLDALAALDYPTYEVVVVDDGSTDGTAEAARAHRLAAADRLRVVSVGDPDAPLGIGASRNRGVEAASYDVIAFTDADCRPTPSWLAALAPCLAVHDLAGGRVRPAGSGPASAYEGVASSLDMGAYGAQVDPDGDTPYLPTANLVGRRAVFEAVPFPDRSVAEDVDVCWRAVAAGYDAVYAPEGVVRHDYRDAPGALAARRATYGASEALLARDYDHDGRRVDVPLDGLLAALAGAVALLSTGAVAVVALLVAGVAGGAGLLARVAGARGQYRRLQSTVSRWDVVESGLRGAVSSAYAVSREVTRYYALPLGGLALLAWPWTPTGSLALVAGLGVAACLPLAVEYAVHRPDAGPLAYASYYSADHAGYQLGVYRGALVHRTLAHLAPASRFRLSGPGAARLVAGSDGPVRQSTAGAGENRLQ